MSTDTAEHQCAIVDGSRLTYGSNIASCIFDSGAVVLSLLDDLLTQPQREKGGSLATQRLDFQACWGLSKVIQLHDGPADYGVAFEFHDDIVVIDSASKPTTAEFFQLKTDDSRTWTLQRISKRTTRAGKPGPSIAGKMYDSRKKFGAAANRLTFVSNQDANFPAGPFSAADKDAYAKFLKDMKREEPTFVEADGSMFYFEKSSFNLSSYESALLGEVVNFVIKHAELHTCNYKAFYLGMMSECQRRSKHLNDISSFSDLVASKFVTRADVTAWIRGLVAETRGHPEWMAIVPDIVHIPPARRAAVKIQWDRYAQERFAGLDLATLELQTVVQRWRSTVGGSSASMATLLEQAVTATKASPAFAKLLPTDDYLVAVILFEFYAP